MNTESCCARPRLPPLLALLLAALLSAHLPQALAQAYGVKVKIRRANEKKAKWELYSDHHGEFAQRVPAGEADYIVWADVKTAKGSSPPEVKVHVINDERQDIGLHLTE